MGTSPLFCLKLFYSDVAVRFTSGLVVIVLVIFFAFPKFFGWAEDGINFMPHGAKQFDNLLGNLLLSFIQIEDFASILRTDVGAYTIGLCWVVNLEEYFAKLFVCNGVGIVIYYDGFYVMGLMRFNFRIFRIFFRSPCVSYNGVEYPL